MNDRGGGLTTTHTLTIFTSTSSTRWCSYQRFLLKTQKHFLPFLGGPCTFKNFIWPFWIKWGYWAHNTEGDNMAQVMAKESNPMDTVTWVKIWGWVGSGWARAASNNFHFFTRLWPWLALLWPLPVSHSQHQRHHLLTSLSSQASSAATWLT